jgi:hypothetical protein
MQAVPLTAVASQNFAATLGNQACQLSLYQRGYNGAAEMYLDLIANGAQILTGRIVRSYGAIPATRAPLMLTGRRYLGFAGDLVMIDTQATVANLTEDPQPAGLGARWQLLYLEVAELEALQ